MIRAAPLTLLLASVAWAHPGGVDDDGCHVCRKNCEKHGVKEGVEHCHHDQDGPVKTERVYVDKVVDGDTLKVRRGAEKFPVRLLGINCPESHVNRQCQKDEAQGRMSCAEQVPLGRRAGEYVAALVKQKKVDLECRGKCGADRFGRALRYVRLTDGRDLGLMLVTSGMCWDFGWKYPHPRGEAYTKAQDEAKKMGRGIWNRE